LYARISRDRADGAGVERQLADGRALAVQRGWEVTEYVDNSVSAYQKRRRPEFERMLDDLIAGRVRGVIAYHPDRLYRRVTELERIVDALERHKATVATVLTGDIDLSSASGRMTARIMAAVAQHDSEHNAERITRAKKQGAANGTPSGGGRRPFGLTEDRTKLVTVEARQLRKTVANLLAGSTLSAEACRLNAAGVTTTVGNQWTSDAVARVVRAPYIAGLRAYKGQVVAENAWPAIIDRSTFERVSTLRTLRRRGRPMTGRYLLTGLLQCELCGARMYVKQTRSRPDEDYVPSYMCSRRLATKGDEAGWVGCGRNGIRVAIAEQFVVERVREWLHDPGWREEVHAFQRDGCTDVGKLRDELDDIERRLVALAERWAHSELSDAEHDAARRVLEDRRDAALAQLPDAEPTTGRLTLRQIERAWRDGSTVQRHAWLAQMAATPIIVRPSRDDNSARRDVSERLLLRPAWS